MCLTKAPVEMDTEPLQASPVLLLCLLCSLRYCDIEQGAQARQFNASDELVNFGF